MGTDRPTRTRKLFTDIVVCDRISRCRESFPKLSEDFGPQPGFIGRQYQRRGVVLLAQNPGHASQASHEVDEETMYWLLRQAQTTGSKADFESSMRHMRCFMDTWPVIRRLRLRERFGLSLDEVAYLNLLKCKTVANKRPTAKMYDTCAAHTTVKQLDLLAPRFVLCLGKSVFDAAAKYISAGESSADWIYHPSGEHFRPEEQRERVKVAADHLATALGIKLST